MHTLLTDMALADALYDNGLAPPDTVKAPTWYSVRGQPPPDIWRPWHSLDAVAHLIERYQLGMAFIRSDEWMIVPSRRRSWLECPTGLFSQLPTLIGNLALALRAREQAQEGGRDGGAPV